ncbi:hypothetical protein DSL92_07780 [Billgrantia gudaonensis]|uniref:HTH lysR-type domain-containing protein n=1 Tax=Billgrantia gudaonensis TaxID=376427 RepID=A0A3S0NEH5_9GAMM|nr:hypothetical protein DSL92_07780 [Halomonas gudaonensis]
MSQQVRALEAYLETALFRRERDEVALTRQGEQLQERVNAALSYLVDAVQTVSATKHSDLSLAANTAVSHLWLSPAMHAFWRRHPAASIHSRLVTSDHSSDLVADDIDIAILYDSPPRQGGYWCRCSKCLFPSRHRLIWIGTVANSGARGIVRASLARLRAHRAQLGQLGPLVRRHGHGGGARARSGVQQLLPAAGCRRAWPGVALGTRHLVDARLAAGTLERLAASGEHGCHYTCRRHHVGDPEVERFTAWLLGWNPLSAKRPGSWIFECSFKINHPGRVTFR